jgi:hypothetical protein
MDIYINTAMINMGVQGSQLYANLPSFG